MLVAQLAVGLPLTSAALAAAQTSELTHPAAGATDVASPLTVRWTSIVDAQAYYLYIGTAVGLTDVVNTGETLAATHTVSLPAGVTLYARMWTKRAHVWRYVDSSFATVLAGSVLTTPASNAMNVPAATTFHWTAVQGAAAYYLYVGTSLGSSNVVNTGETAALLHAAAFLPAGATLFARMWTKRDGAWEHRDSTFTTVPVVSRVIKPADNGFVTAAPITVEWTGAPGAQSYYLYIGTTLGAKDVVDSGETLLTGVVTTTLPRDRTLYLRHWTKLAGIWWRSDSTAHTTGADAVLMTPLDESVFSPLSAAFKWRPVANAEAYYLYVGTTPGAKDVVNSGELQGTTYTVHNLGGERTLYARLHTRRAGSWHYLDTTITTGVSRASLIAPTNGSVGVMPDTSFTWTRVPEASAYRLTAGLSPGSSELFDSTETLETHSGPATLPEGALIYVSLATKLGTLWSVRDYQIRTATVTARFTYPTDGDPALDVTRPFTWTPISGAEAYFLYVGTTVGGDDLLSSGELLQTQLRVDTLPTGTTFHARLWTKVGVWRFVDATFTSARLRPEFVYPRDKQHGVDLAREIEWTAVPLASAYRLTISTSPSLDDALIERDGLMGTSVSVPGLPAQTLYARIQALVNGTWHFSDAVFTAQATSAPSHLSGAELLIGRPGDRPFRWAAVPMAQAYRFQIGTSAGGSDVDDTGDTLTTVRFVRNAPVGVPLFGTLGTKLDDVWSMSAFVLSMASDGNPDDARRVFALASAVDVRAMGDARAIPRIGSLLARETIAAKKPWAFCTQFATGLIRSMSDAGLGDGLRVLNVAFNSNGDGHTLVEMFDTPAASWMLLDPLFTMTPTVADDGRSATAEDLRASAQSSLAPSIAYEPLTAQSRTDLEAYYIDYPLLFLNLYRDYDRFVLGQGTSPLPYLTPVAASVSAAPATYVVQCDSGLIQVGINGVQTELACDGIDHLTAAFVASQVELPADAPASARLFRLKRSVF